MNRELKRVLNYLNEERGFDFSGYRASMVERRMEKRLTPTKCADFPEYLEYLKQHPHELDNLVDVLTINVSRFFRNTLAFDYIAGKILPAMVFDKLHSRDLSLRIWSAGCATGEEPYSIAILIRELQRKEKLNL
ncbi:MAG: protein-glutamate O-methyltransferase CheR, partial [Deltaproteobacteria bacterium]|nr:protein-glutamate O-methyltransferase CheR [Deltaproteobacteria bacterium]